jgi:hypothetical protein
MLNNRNGESRPPSNTRVHLLRLIEALEKPKTPIQRTQMPTGEWRGMMEHLARCRKMHCGANGADKPANQLSETI